MIKPRIGCFAIYELSEEDWQNAGEQMDNLRSSLETEGLEVVISPVPVTDEASCKRSMDFFSANNIDVLCPLIITWCLDHYIWMIQKATGVPVAVRAIPGLRNGSVVGAEQIGCIFEDLDIDHRLFYGEVGDREEARKLAVFSRACAVKKRLAGAKIAMVGRRTPGMTPTAFDEVEIMRLFGCQIVTYGMDEITAIGNKFDDAQVKKIWDKVADASKKIVDVVPGEDILSIRYYLALKQLVEQNGLSAISVGCYPSYCGITCLPIAMLIDEGIPVGCEGDMNSTIAMYILQQLTGKPVHFGEMCVVDHKENYILSSHCGAAPASMADEKGYILCPVRLAHTGVCIRYSSKPGHISYVNLVGRKNKYRLCAFKGRVEETPLVYEGNPMKIVPNTSVSKIWNTVAENGFGHHWMAVYNDIVPELRELCALTGIKGVFPDIDE